jgi:two-component system, NarL family, response regulator LiaR
MLNQISRTELDILKLVIVEDNKLIRLGLTALLKSYHQIQLLAEVGDAEAGIESVKKLHPDIVIMDISLPGMDGIEATQIIKDFDPTIKVIMYSSHEGREQVIASLGSGADAYCVKDNNPDKLIDIIEAVSLGESWLDPALASVAMSIVRNRSNSNAESNGNKLTDRELEVLKCITEGKSNYDIANELFISVNTAKEHVSNIIKKLAVHDRVQAAVHAIKEGLIEDN